VRHATNVMLIMRKTATKRARSKQESLDRILYAAARRLRDAGLTHGAFYSHFDTKEQLANTAFAYAITTGRRHWIEPMRDESWADRLASLAKRYLTPAHRDDLSTSCAFAAVGADAARASEDFRAVYERELRGSLAAICGEDDADDQRLDDAVALMAVCVGGLSLARAVADRQFSTRILRVARGAAIRLAGKEGK
jgi:TetR/AcrR family transcriptional repressor of nem operon